ncbi:phosphatidylinositol 4,5-bisphosphate 5-phosphatase A-like [Phasianus colchicus]|uniref:phosphatidylinositol 4,5-bisphosphate 5-phosphatase A-like n=1 Tax=Phasianus colchicus TaxID=9054 RepID=UPI00129D847E|nr:phosphatidylinositol 4,5-bisphosphate 5-phosphatase A-like [Phasianus colchicus]
MVVGGSSQKENRTPGPNDTVKRFPYGRVPVRTRSRCAEHGERPNAACTAPSCGQPRDAEVEQPPPPALDVETTVTPSPVATPVLGAAGRRPCLARRVPARAPPSAKGPSPLSTAGTQTALLGPLQEGASMGLRVPKKKKNGTPGSSSAGLTLCVSVTKNMRSAPRTQSSLRTPCLTPCISQPRALQVGGSLSTGKGSQPAPPAPADGVVPSETPLRWRPAVTPQSDPRAYAAVSNNNLSPSWDKVVVQLFKGNEGQQDAKVTMTHPSSTPGPSKAQRAALLLQQLLQMVQDRPDAVAVLTELWGLMTELGVDPMPQDPLDTHSLSS